jgi:hypothetical protein
MPTPREKPLPSISADEVTDGNRARPRRERLLLRGRHEFHAVLPILLLGRRPMRGCGTGCAGSAARAASGALDYDVGGGAIGGFAVLAWPAKYGNSGTMSFMVNQGGKLYQADPGRDNQVRTAKMRRFDPGAGWSAVAAR